MLKVGKASLVALSTSRVMTPHADSALHRPSVLPDWLVTWRHFYTELLRYPIGFRLVFAVAVVIADIDVSPGAASTGQPNGSAIAGITHILKATGIGSGGGDAESYCDRGDQK
ncbi:MAG: hypothetical protein QOE77_2896 [Blastocatellia bacterium]|jgi:hypothetical protein|nr:hypothetical protein [Blastocatellia bacterium]